MVDYTRLETLRCDYQVQHRSATVADPCERCTADDGRVVSKRDGEWVCQECVDEAETEGETPS